MNDAHRENLLRKRAERLVRSNARKEAEKAASVRVLSQRQQDAIVQPFDKKKNGKLDNNKRPFRSNTSHKKAKSWTSERTASYS